MNKPISSVVNAFNAWLHTFAPAFCDAQQVALHREAIEKAGGLNAYIDQNIRLLREFQDDMQERLPLRELSVIHDSIRALEDWRVEAANNPNDSERRRLVMERVMRRGGTIGYLTDIRIRLEELAERYEPVAHEQY